MTDDFNIHSVTQSIASQYQVGVYNKVIIYNNTINVGLLLYIPQTKPMFSLLPACSFLRKNM